MVTPVTAASVERSNSTLRYVKNSYRSSIGEERLNALLLLSSTKTFYWTTLGSWTSLRDAIIAE